MINPYPLNISLDEFIIDYYVTNNGTSDPWTFYYKDKIGLDWR